MDRLVDPDYFSVGIAVSSQGFIEEMSLCHGRDALSACRITLEEGPIWWLDGWLTGVVAQGRVVACG